MSEEKFFFGYNCETHIPIAGNRRLARVAVDGWGFEYVSLRHGGLDSALCVERAKPCGKVWVSMGIYVVQVVGGQEAKAAGMIAGVARTAVQDCFVPRREVMRREGGAWHKKCERLFPGYVFVQTEDPIEVRNLLRAVPTFTRMLGAPGDTFLPLTRDEVTWINVHTNAETHVVEMSEGIIEGDRVVVTSGPLKGQEASISHVDRHKRLAWLDMDMFGCCKTIRVGLEIVSNR